MAEDRATVTIYRYDPDTDQAPWFQTFDEIPYLGMSVLDVLKYIYEHLDPGLAFRYSCRTEPCVVCSIRVNGKGVLSCCKVAEKVMRIEPPGGNLPIIKDLVVDFKKLDRRRQAKQ